MSNTRRAQPHVSMEASGVVYLLHFHQRLGTDRHYAQHYLGSAYDLDDRVGKHRNGQGARITQVLKERGIGFDVVAVWPGNRQIENALKLHSATRICPACTPNPRTPLIIRKAIEAEERRRGQAARQNAEVTAAARPKSPYQRGAALADLFVRAQVAAGRTAGQIAAAHGYITGPWRERARASEAQAETLRGYSEKVTAALARLREEPAARARAELARTRPGARAREAKPGAARWRQRRRVAERADGLPQNADGSLSRSRTTDAQKLAAGVMTQAQQAEHTALGGGHPAERKTTKGERERIQRLTASAAPRRPDPWASPTAQARPARQHEMEPEAG